MVGVCVCVDLAILSRLAHLQEMRTMKGEVRKYCIKSDGICRTHFAVLPLISSGRCDYTYFELYTGIFDGWCWRFRLAITFLVK